jgi:hypothetical protein
LPPAPAPVGLAPPAPTVEVAPGLPVLVPVVEAGLPVSPPAPENSGGSLSWEAHEGAHKTEATRMIEPAVIDE